MKKSNMKIKTNKNLKKSLKIFKESVFYLFILFLILTASLNFYSRLTGDRPSVLGYSTLIVISDSMEPTFMVNEFLILKEIPFENVEKGNIVSFYYDVNNDGSDNLITHRVEQIVYDSEDKIDEIKTRGDKTVNGIQAPMEIVKEEDFVGKIVFNSFFIGNSLHFMVENHLFVILVGGLFLYLIVQQIISIANTYDEIKFEKKKKKKKE